jgi:hypothetical protein
VAGADRRAGSEKHRDLRLCSCRGQPKSFPFWEQVRSRRRFFRRETGKTGDGRSIPSKTGTAETLLPVPCLANFLAKRPLPSRLRPCDIVGYGRARHPLCSDSEHARPAPAAEPTLAAIKLARCTLDPKTASGSWRRRWITRPKRFTTKTIAEGSCPLGNAPVEAYGMRRTVPAAINMTRCYLDPRQAPRVRRSSPCRWCRLHKRTIAACPPCLGLDESGEVVHAHRVGYAQSR